MGKLVDGKWKTGSIITSDKDGKYDRKPRSFKDIISKDHNKFTPESGRYHLYVSYACPWAQRTLIYRSLKNLEDHIDVSIVHPHLLEDGWSFDKNFANATGDKLYDLKYLYQIYQKADPDINTSVTVPVLWDKKNQTVVNNESSEIIRIFNEAFNELTNNYENYYPKNLQNNIDELNDEIYHNINNGVYKAGFAKNQKAHEEAVEKLFSQLDKLEEILSNSEYLTGNNLTEADIRLIPTLLRFDIVYYIHFKCCKKQIKDYHNLYRYTKKLYNIPAIKKNTNFDHIKEHYYYSHQELNPYRIVPLIQSNL